MRLFADDAREENWKRWGPYLSERQWGTVREDYSANGDAWAYLPHDHARSRAYRWGEDGLLGITDRQCRLCFALALWNGEDPILKERLFGVTGPEGNHGEDVKEYYFYLDSSPTHSYLKALYKYPQRRFPYEWLLEESRRRGRSDPEPELIESGAFADNRYFDVFAEYAKRSPNDVLIRITVVNRGSEKASLLVLPTLWFRNTWSWGEAYESRWGRPSLRLDSAHAVLADHGSLGRFHLRVEPHASLGAPEAIFTENETNNERLFGVASASPYVKDAFHRYLIGGETTAINPALRGTKCALAYRLEMPPGATERFQMRLFGEAEAPAAAFGEEFEATFSERLRETDEVYAARMPAALSRDERLVVRQACAGLLWTKQFYYYVVKDWLEGDSASPPPPGVRRDGRNSDWIHAFNRDVISMPDKWEYPWFAAWDLAFHMIPFSRVDPFFAKDQLILLLREWYMHPNGEIPAYEWSFSDVNPPVHAWACWRVYKMTAARGLRDRHFLSRAFQKLLINFTWWVNRKDPDGQHLFSGGFLGLDNIGVFDRSRPLPTGGYLEQADGTAWMAFYCATMLSIALELAQEDPAAEDIASKFFEHFVAIADAMNHLGGTGLWDEEDGFYYDQLRLHGRSIPLRVRSLVGLIPLISVEVLEHDAIDRLPGFRKRMEWFLRNRRDLSQQISYMEPDEGGPHGHRLLAIPSRQRLSRLLGYLLDEEEFLSPYGFRSLSRIHRERPFQFRAGDTTYEVAYVPGESDSGMFGGNSNWRGPIWFPINYLIVEALERYHHFYGDDFRIEYPSRSGQQRTLREVADDVARRLTRPFLRDSVGARPCHGGLTEFAVDPYWRDLVLFHEYFHGDNGRGLGASHQTGWTALVVNLLDQIGKRAT